MSKKRIGAPAIPISDWQYRLIEKAASKQTISHQEKIRFSIILRASQGQSNSQVKRDLGISLNKVKRWRRRWETAWSNLNTFEAGLEGQPPKDYELLGRIRQILSDEPRSGTPKRITLSQEQQITALACEKPEQHGVMMTQWNREMLAQTAVKLGIVETISPR